MEGCTLPPPKRFQNGKKPSLIGRFRYFRYENCSLGLLKLVPSSFVPSCLLHFHTSGVLSRPYPHLHLFSEACSSFATLAPHLAPDLFVETAAFSGSLKRDITGVYWPGYLPQVPSKKAELKESLLQIMDDEDDCLDKYLVRKLLVVHEPYPAALLETKPSFFMFRRRRTGGSSRPAYAWSRRTTALLIS